MIPPLLDNPLLLQGSNSPSTTFLPATIDVRPSDPEKDGTISHETGSGESADLSGHVQELGYVQELTRNRSMVTLLFQSLAIAAIPYSEGSPLISAIYSGGQLSLFIGWIVVCILYLSTLR